MKNLFILSMYTSKLKATGWLIPIGMSIGAFLGVMFDSIALMNVFLGFMVADTITGMLSAVKQGIPITSLRVRETFYKWVAYGFIIYVGLGIEVLTGSMEAHTLSLGWVLLSEGISILENCQIITGKKIPLLGMLQKLMKKYKIKDCNNKDDSV